MAKTLTVAGDNFLPFYKTNTAKIREIVQNKSNVMTMQFAVKDIADKPLEGSELVFKDGARFLFGGYISQVKPFEVGAGQLYIFDTEVSDYSYIFNNKIARRAYSNQTLEYIVEDLLSEYVDASYGYTTTNVATGPTIESITFDHISIRKCFEKLQKLTGYVWFVDYEKNLYFQAPSADAAPETITEATDNFSEISIAYDTSQVRNSVIVIGRTEGEQDSNTTTENFAGDGETRSWEVATNPAQVVSISLNGSPQQFSLDLNERDTDYFVYSFASSSFRVTDAQTTPVGGGTPDDIEIVYYGSIPIIAQEIDAASVAFFAALDGGDGVYEYTIKEPSITSKEEASARALQELEEFAMALVNGEFKTRTTLLGNPASIFTAGQYLTVNLPTHGINTDTAFLIQEVNISMVEDKENATTEYFYDVRFGGKMVGVQEFLESLAAEEGDVTEADVIITIESLTDAFIADDDAPTEDTVSPPFEYGPSGSPQGRYNMAEYS